MLHIYILGKQKISCQIVFWAIESGAGPGFDVRGDEIRQGVWGQLKVPGGSRAGPWWGWMGGQVGKAPQKLLGFEHLNSVSVNDLKHFVMCLYQNKHSSMHRSLVQASQVRATFYGREKSSQNFENLRVNGHL